MKFREIPQFICDGGYEVNVFLATLEKTIEGYVDDFNLDLNPDFQRGHVWTKKQREAYIDYFLKGGRGGKVIYLNMPSWQGQAHSKYDDFVIVDGLQRLTTLRMFITNKLKAFGLLYKDFDDEVHDSSLKFNINSLKTKSAVLSWYLQMNYAGTPHTKKELDRVSEMLNQIEPKS